jgi:hypothetical protein
MQHHYATFLDTPIPALDDRTPRQAARDPALRERLDALLRDHEYGTTQRIGESAVDFAAMRRELGLPT